MTAVKAKAAAARCEEYRKTGFFVPPGDVDTYKLAFMALAQLLAIQEETRGKPQ
ncbi:MAG TPA: hypothetical protein VIL65_12795 [Beijerinckiaceae bacterium]|jgi:hypothetical protein